MSTVEESDHIRPPPPPNSLLWDEGRTVLNRNPQTPPPPLSLLTPFVFCFRLTDLGLSRGVVTRYVTLEVRTEPSTLVMGEESPSMFFSSSSETRISRLLDGL